MFVTNLEKKENEKFDYDILFVCPPYLTEDPPLAFFRDESFKFQIINPGILTIASYLKKQGFSVKIIDASVDQDYGKIKEELQKSTPRIVGISNNTGFDYLESLQCLDIIRKNSPRSTTIIGGEHCGSLGTTIFNETDNLDVLFTGEGEVALEQLLTKEKKDYNTIKGIIFKKEDGTLHISTESAERLPYLPQLDYSMYPEVTQFTPYVEESRGCPKKCKFCPNVALYGAKVKYKSIDTLSKELDQILDLWGNKKIVALLTSNFGMNPKINIIGSMVLDEKACNTAHVAIGSNYWFGGDIKTFLHLDQVMRNPEIFIDGKRLEY